MSMFWNVIIRKKVQPFIQVPWLASSGTQYVQINSGFDNTDEIYAKAYLIDLSGDKYMIAPRTWNTNNNRFFMLGGFRNVGIGYGSVTTGNTDYPGNVPKQTNLLYEQQYKDFKFTNFTINQIFNVANITWGSETNQLRLFYGYDKPTAGKMVSFTHIKSGLIVEDLIPVVCLANKYYIDGNTGQKVLALTNKPGMYDKISKKLFVNQGTGEFTYQLSIKS